MIKGLMKRICERRQKNDYIYIQIYHTFNERVTIFDKSGEIMCSQFLMYKSQFKY